MPVPVTIEIEQELLERTTRLAAQRGISLNQLVSQQLERATAQDEYTRLQQKVAEHRRLNKPAMPAQRAAKRRS
tara:strand:+ start:56 stop:277 length:222 start_codon:yes stop_codon:yes gene_type:complete